MEIVDTIDLISRLDEIEPEGFQVVISKGALRSTKAIYKSGKQYFIFDMSDKFEFESESGITLSEFLDINKNWQWLIEMTIS